MSIGGGLALRIATCFGIVVVASMNRPPLDDARTSTDAEAMRRPCLGILGPAASPG